MLLLISKTFEYCQSRKKIVALQEKQWAEIPSSVAKKGAYIRWRKDC